MNASNQIRPNRMPISSEIPSISEIIDRKNRKKLILEGTELFNSKNPNEGINFLAEKGILKNPLDPIDVVEWLRHNSKLDKNKIAEYICNRKNTSILQAFVASFQFENLRLDEALRKFLETFRLPGESAEISKIMQYFSENWYKANNEPFEGVDAAFTLSYAIIMLNVDQHNPQVRRLQPPMTVASFKKNLTGTNGGKNFEEEMLEKIYYAIKNEEIVMPAEQTGIVKENYLWKVLLRRGETEEGIFLHAPVGWNDHDLFTIIWSAATAALSYVFDKSHDESILTKSLSGYRKCASIAAYYGMTNVFDNLIIHLCKFSTLMTSNDDSTHTGGSEQVVPSIKINSFQSLEAMTILFAKDKKAQMAAKTMFYLVHKHGDNLREGWKNVLDCILHLFKANLLPLKLVEVECFVDPKKFVSLSRTKQQKTMQLKQETSILSWLGFVGTNDSNYGKQTSIEHEKLTKLAKTIIADCHPEQLLTDSKYLTLSALNELMNSIVYASQQIAFISLHSSDIQVKNACILSESESSIISTNRTSENSNFQENSDILMMKMQREDCIVFLLELLTSILLENRDRLMQIWPVVKLHLHFLLSNFNLNPRISERAIIAVLKIANCTLFRLNEDKSIAEEILQSLMLLLQLCVPTSEDVGVRAVQLVSKIFLHHLMVLSKMPSFITIVKELLVFMEKYVKMGESELLADAIPESLKNIVLVLDNSGLLSNNLELYNLIFKHLIQFLPELVTEVMQNVNITNVNSTTECLLSSSISNN